MNYFPPQGENQMSSTIRISRPGETITATHVTGSNLYKIGHGSMEGEFAVRIGDQLNLLTGKGGGLWLGSDGRCVSWVILEDHSQRPQVECVHGVLGGAPKCEDCVEELSELDRERRAEVYGEGLDDDQDRF